MGNVSGKQKEEIRDGEELSEVLFLLMFGKRVEDELVVRSV